MNRPLRRCHLGWVLLLVFGLGLLAVEKTGMSAVVDSSGQALLCVSAAAAPPFSTAKEEDAKGSSTLLGTPYPPPPAHHPTLLLRPCRIGSFSYRPRISRSSMPRPPAAPRAPPTSGHSA